MALQYDSDVKNGYSSVPRYVDDQTGEEFLDFQGMLGPPPNQGFDPMAGATAQGPMGALEAATAKLAPGPPPMQPPAPPRQAADVQPDMSVDPSQMMSLDPGVSQMGAPSPPPAQQLREPPPPAPVDPAAPSPVAPYGAKYVPGRAAREAQNVPETIKTKGNPGEYDELRGHHLGIMDRRLQIADIEGERQAAELSAQRDETLSRAMRASVAANEAKAKEISLQQAKEAELAKVEEARQNYKSKRTDPNRLYRNMGAAGSFGAIIMAGLGGFLQGKTGRPNQALEIINQAIDRDIAQQENDRQNAGENYQDAQTEYARKIRDGMDPERAREEIKLHQKEQAIAAIENLEATTKLGYLATDTEKLKLALEEETLEHLTKLQDRIGSEVTLKHVPGQSASRGGFKPLTLAEAAEEAKLKAQMGESYVSVDKSSRALAGGQSDDPLDLYWQGKPVGKAKTDVEARALRSELSTSEHLLRTIDEIDRLAEDWSSLSPSERAEAEAMVTHLQLNLKGEAAYKLGVLTGPDMELLEKVANNPNQFFTTEANSKARLGATRRNLLDLTNSRLRGQGINVPVDRAAPKINYVDSPDDFVRQDGR